ncbi:hypothetical protein ACNKHK_11090 [Shigella flexneri]
MVFLGAGSAGCGIAGGSSRKSGEKGLAKKRRVNAYSWSIAGLLTTNAEPASFQTKLVQNAKISALGYTRCPVVARCGSQR